MQLVRGGYNETTDKSYGIFKSPFVNHNDKPFLTVEVMSDCSHNPVKRVVAELEYEWTNCAPVMEKALRIAKEAIR